MNLEALRARFEQLRAIVEQLIEKAQSGGSEEPIGTFFSNFDSEGFPAKLVIKGMKIIPTQYLRAYANHLDICARVYDINFGIVETIEESAMRNCFGPDNINPRTLRLPDTVKIIGDNAFAESRFSIICFKGTPENIATTAFAITRATDIYCPWAEGAVANAPWGATNATIHYNSEV